MSRFRRAMVGLIKIMMTIHPMWAIDEYARIFRRCVWFSPPQPPRNVDKMAKVIRIFMLSDGEI